MTDQPLSTRMQVAHGGYSCSAEVAALEREVALYKAAVDNRWVVAPHPRNKAGFVCESPWLTWPSCVLGEGETAVEAIRNALATRQTAKEGQ